MRNIVKICKNTKTDDTTKNDKPNKKKGSFIYFKTFKLRLPIKLHHDDITMTSR